MIPEQYRERLRVRLQDARGSLVGAHSAVRGLCEEYGELRGSDAELESQIGSAIEAVEVAMRLVRRLPPGERFESGINRLQAALGESARGPSTERWEELRAAAREVLETNAEVRTASGLVGDGSIRD